MRRMRLDDVHESLGHFGTVLMCGNSLGLLGSRARAGRLLRSLRGLADRIVASSNNPHATADPAYLAYQERNDRRGRMPGQLVSASEVVPDCPGAVMSPRRGFPCGKQDLRTTYDVKYETMRI